MKRAILLALLVMGFNGFLNPALSMDWNRLDGTTKEFKAAYFSGAYDGYRTMRFLKEANEIFCMPDGVTNMQLAAVAEKYIVNNPEKWNHVAAYEAFIAWKEAWPCK